MPTPGPISCRPLGCKSLGRIVSAHKFLARKPLVRTLLARKARQASVAAALLLSLVAVAERAATGSEAASARPTRVIELFTSQGCPACPPADRLIADLARRPDTVALSFAVDTWDYTGWKDTLASRAFTARQQAYAAARGDRRVFTPQVIVDGITAEVGADEAAILRDTAALAGRDGAMSVPLAVVETGATLAVTVGAAPPDGATRRSAGVYVLRVARSTTVAIGRGRNSGREITYTNVVRAMTRIGDWNGEEAHFSMPSLAGENEGFVVLLQSDPPGGPGVILAAAKTAGL